MALQSYRDLLVWQRAMDLTESVYKITQEFPSSEKFGLVSQMRRCSVSIPSNIAEGYGRSHRGDYLRHLSIANGSKTEWETQYLIAVRIHYVSDRTGASTWELMQEAGRLLHKHIASLTPKPQTLTPNR
jgi:four helix bundle protein